MHRNRSVSAHQFAMVPRSDVPRSRFNVQTSHKTTFDAGYLIPIYMDEVLPGDSFSLDMTAFARMSTPIFPIMDNLHMDTFFFFVPNRLVWDNWQKFMGEQKNPGDSIDYLVPQMEKEGGYDVGSIFDHFGLPTVGQVLPDGKVYHSSLPLRAYNLIYNEWFRDENLENSLEVRTGDSNDPASDYELRRRGKRHDYFTSALPWPQKGGAVQLPLGTSAPLKARSDVPPLYNAPGFESESWFMSLKNGPSPDVRMNTQSTISGEPLTYFKNQPLGPHAGTFGALYADLSEATGATINALRTAFQIQKLLERDARGGTRYTEIIRSHFGVVSPDARLQRPEYLGGGTTNIAISPVAQTSGTPTPGNGTPLGNLAAFSTALSRNGFSHSFVEHGIVIGLVCVRADLNYQQGLRRYWSRRTRYDFYFPAFAHLGEQAVLSKEIFCNGHVENDNAVFGYQERWGEYRYHPSMITSRFRSTAAQTLDAWHLAQKFENRPALNAEFIRETPPLERILATSGLPESNQFIFDSFFNIKMTRPMPLYSVPGFIDRF